MTSEEIKQTYSMQDILLRYGLRPNRAGTVHCPFHQGDREPSMKIYPKDFHCFGCGANGDIFTFVMMMEGVSFKEAFRLLGGEYEHQQPGQPRKMNFRLYHLQKQKEMDRKREEAERLRHRLNLNLIHLYRAWIRKTKPFSDTWCECQKELTRQLMIFEDWYGESHGHQKA